MSLNNKFDEIKQDMSNKTELFNNNTESALVFLINHFETLKSYQSYRTRSQFRSHVIDLMNKEYGAGNYSERDVLRVMDKEGYFSSTLYFFISFAIASIITLAVNYFVDTPYIIIFNLLFVFVGSLILTVILEMWNMK